MPRFAGRRPRRGATPRHLHGPNTIVLAQIAGSLLHSGDSERVESSLSCGGEVRGPTGCLVQ